MMALVPDQPPPPEAPAGWLPDPSDPAKYRYWDGSQWSDHWTKNPNKPTPWDHAPTPVTPATPRHRPAVLTDPARKKPQSQRFAELPTIAKVGIIALAGAALIGFAAFVTFSSDDSDPARSPASALLPAHRSMVDTLARQGDCSSLQDRFDDAYDNRGPGNTEKHTRNLALMEYADDAMRRIGCYD
jgi:hypothetical protein